MLERVHCLPLTEEEIRRRKRMEVIGKVFRIVMFPLALIIAIIYKSYTFAWTTINEIF